MIVSRAISPENAALRLEAATPEELAALGRVLAPALAPGDIVALRGPLGAGKSHLARAVIRARLDEPEAEVPSPSYTLVNIYRAGDVEIWHVDLYRVGRDEIEELGLADAPADAILLVEWAERWSDMPARRLDIEMAFAGDEGRELTVTAQGDGWQSALRALGGRA